MPRRERAELKRQELNLFAGDYERLAEILAPKKIAPGTFIRNLVRWKLRQIEDRASLTHNKMEPLDDNFAKRLATESSSS